MTTNSRRLSELQTSNTVATTDLFVATVDPTGNTATKHISFSTVKSTMIKSLTPVGNTVPEFIGQLYYDTNFLYVAVSNTLIKKISLSSL